MGAAVRKLDAKARSALAVLVVVVLLILALVVRSAIVGLTPEAKVAAAVPEYQDELIQIGGHVLLLKGASSGARIAHWLDAGSKNARAFEVGDQAFAPSSAKLTREGQSEAGIFADMVSHVQSLKARILVSTELGDRSLSQSRAESLRAELIQHGVPPSHIVVSTEAVKGGKALSTQPELLVVLSA